MHAHAPAAVGSARSGGQCATCLPASGAEAACTLPGRMKREEARIAAEMEEREQEEARKLLEAAQKRMGAKRLVIAEGAHLDKQQLMTQARPCCPPAAQPLCLLYCGRRACSSAPTWHWSRTVLPQLMGMAPAHCALDPSKLADRSPLPGLSRPLLLTPTWCVHRGASIHAFCGMWYLLLTS